MVAGVSFGIDKAEIWLPPGAVRLRQTWQDIGMNLDRGRVYSTGEVTEKHLLNDASGAVVGAKLFLSPERTEGTGVAIEISPYGLRAVFNPSSNGRSLTDSTEALKDRTIPVFDYLNKIASADWDAAILKRIDIAQDSNMKHIYPTYLNAFRTLSMKRQPENKLAYPDSLRWGQRGRQVSVIVYDRGKKLAGITDSTKFMRVEAQVTSRKGSDKIGKLYGLRTWADLCSADIRHLQVQTRHYLSTDLFKFSPAEYGQQHLPVTDILTELDSLLKIERQAMRAINSVCRWYSIDALLTAVNGLEGLSDHIRAAGRSDRTARHIIASLRQELNYRAIKRKATQTDSILHSTYSEVFARFAA